MARARKPEYPTDFMHECRRAYSRLAGIVDCMTIIPPLPLPQAKREVENAMARALSMIRAQVIADLETVS